jgi:hypothetical protein
VKPANHLRTHIGLPLTLVAFSVASATACSSTPEQAGDGDGDGDGDAPGDGDLVGDGDGDPGGTGGAESVTFSRPLGVITQYVYSPDQIGIDKELWQTALVSPTLESEHHNQPHIINGYLQLTGNARFSTYDISEPAAPQQISVMVSPDDCSTCGPKNEGEAEGHQVSFARYGDQLYTVTISGLGIDLWNITVPESPSFIKSIPLEGVDFGDFTEAVWGVYWQGYTIYAGGTNTGLHVINATEPENAAVVARVPTAMLGGVSAGPVYPVGNVLVVTTPKESGGIATLDISHPFQPMILDSITTSTSYIGAFYGHHAYLQAPVRSWDVLSDPTNIGEPGSPVGSLATEPSEYMSFADGYMFLGLLRPNPGALKIDVTDPSNMVPQNRIWGRLDLSGNDDQFTVAVGNLLVMSDDQLQENGEGYVGTVIGVHAADPDIQAPIVDTVIPKDGATGQSVSTRVGISFTDNVELATVDLNSFIVRPVGGGAPVEGSFGIYMGVLNFDPLADLAPGTEYEVILPVGGITDYVGNAISEEFRSTFTTQ